MYGGRVVISLFLKIHSHLLLLLRGAANLSNHLGVFIRIIYKGHLEKIRVNSKKEKKIDPPRLNAFFVK